MNAKSLENTSAMASMTEDQVVMVCDLNNAGVDLLDSGHFDSALVMLERAVWAANALVYGDAADENCACAATVPVRENAPSDPSFRASIVGGCCHSGWSYATENSPANFTSSEDGVFIYNRAFKLRYDDGIPPLGTICIIILYNMAIGCHLHNSSPQRLKQATTWYGLALSACLDGTIPSEIPPILRLVMLNNLGEIYFRLGQFDDMKDIHNLLKKAWRDDQTFVLVGEPFLNEIEKEGLLWNVLFLEKPDIAAAA